MTAFSSFVENDVYRTRRHGWMSRMDQTNVLNTGDRKTTIHQRCSYVRDNVHERLVGE
jgi:hypothetical protein